MPEMSVVCFTESDVIVASPTAFFLNKAGDGRANNANVKYNNTYYGTGQQHSWDDFYRDFTSNTGYSIGSGTDLHYDRNGVVGDVTFDGIQIIDRQIGQTNAGIDGSYVWRNGQFYSYQ